MIAKIVKGSGMFRCKSLTDISLTETFPQVFACRYACASCPAFQRVVIRCRQFHGNTIFQFVGMANNLNQLAHKANAGGFDTAKLECRVQVARIEELLNHILL